MGPGTTEGKSVGYIVDGLIHAINLIVSLDPEVLEITTLSLQVSGTATLLAAAVGIPAGVLIALNEFPLKRVLRSLINTFMGLPPVVVGLFTFLILSNAGPLGSLRLLFTPTAMIVVQFVLVAPIVTGLSIAAAGAVDRSVIETAISLGAKRHETMLLVVNEARQALLIAAIAGFGRAIAEVGAVMIVGGDLRWKTRVLTTAIMLQTSMGDFSLAIALGIILLTIAFVINLFMSIFQRDRR
ncbi:MAG TPA: ABC transporter permease [Methanocella sp.]|nr:ABC transporter permease [Methanocella sp.]